jgi:hypothetical protein
MKPFDAAAGEIARKQNNLDGAYREQPGDRTKPDAASQKYTDRYRVERADGKSNIDAAVIAWGEAFPGTTCPLARWATNAPI